MVHGLHQACVRVGMCREVVEWMRERETGGATCVLVALAASVVACLAITDPLKPEAVGVVAALRGLGLQVGLPLPCGKPGWREVGRHIHNCMK